MFQGFDFYRYVQGLYEQLAHQRERLIHLERVISELSTAIKSLEDKPTTHVDRIEYHFDQLKVERLEGTLNIGITPQAGGSIDDYAVGEKVAQDVKVEAQKPDLSRSICHRIDSYLFQEAEQEIHSMEKQYNKPVGAEYRKVLVEDVRRQVEQRVNMYLERKEFAPNQGQDEKAIEDQVVDRMKQDIRSALQQYFMQRTSTEGSIRMEGERSESTKDEF